MVSLGFDTYHLDPIGDLALTTEGYHEMGRRVAALGRRLVILQEGGYHVGDLGTNAVAWLRGADGGSAAGPDRRRGVRSPDHADHRPAGARSQARRRDRDRDGRGPRRDGRRGRA